MANRKPKNLIKGEEIEDTTSYGEFIPSFDQWTTFERQRHITNHLERCTKKHK